MENINQSEFGYTNSNEDIIFENQDMHTYEGELRKEVDVFQYSTENQTSHKDFIASKFEEPSDFDGI